MADIKYPKDVPVDEPVAPRKAMKMPAGKPMPKAKSRPMYQDSVPVDEPVAPSMPMAAPAAGTPGMKRGGTVKKMASGGSASSRADGIATKGKTKGTMVMCGGGMAKGKR
jgi:hypothetical protein